MLIKWLINILLFLVVLVSQAHAETVVAPTHEQLPIKEYVLSKKIPNLYAVAMCESRLDITAIGDHGLAYGIFQFHKETFELYSKKYGLDLDYTDPYDQTDLAARMFNNNLQYHWSCYKKVTR